GLEGGPPRRGRARGGQPGHRGRRLRAPGRGEVAELRDCQGGARPVGAPVLHRPAEAGERRPRGALRRLRDRPPPDLQRGGLSQTLGERHVRRITTPLAALLALVLAAGCARRQRNEDFIPAADTARAALEAYLTAWQQGRPTDPVADTAPAVMGADQVRAGG